MRLSIHTHTLTHDTHMYVYLYICIYTFTCRHIQTYLHTYAVQPHKYFSSGKRQTDETEFKTRVPWRMFLFYFSFSFLVSKGDGLPAYIFIFRIGISDPGLDKIFFFFFFFWTFMNSKIVELIHVLEVDGDGEEERRGIGAKESG